MQKDERRLFFGWEILAPWPETFPSGRLIEADNRHLTLAFLGKTDYLQLSQNLPSFPKPTWEIGLVGHFQGCLFLPEKDPHVAAWEMKFSDFEPVRKFHKSTMKWLKKQGYSLDFRDLMPHVTIARSPFNTKEWQKSFYSLPFVMKDLHLYESSGNLKYTPLWSLSLLAPFEELDHTADLAYTIRGIDYNQLYEHAAYALAFHFPKLLLFMQQGNRDSLNAVIADLNLIVTRADQEIGSPFKAVSYHSHLKKENNHMIWEMIIDV